MKTYPMRCNIRAEAGVTRIDVYDDIGEGGWFSEGLSAKSFAAQMATVKGPLDVHINSYGGEVGDGIAIGNAIRNHNGPKKTIVDGFAASIASVIAQAGDERVMEPGSMMMIHDALSGCYGNAADLQEMAGFLDKHSDNLAEIYASRAGGTAQQWRDTMRKDTWYTAEEAVAAGLADRIGTGTAVLPAGMDVAAFTAIPGRIAARLRTMPAAALPQDAARHDPMTGTHSHPHPAYGSQGGDGMHSHEHSHDGEASHSHDHGDGAADRGARNAPGKPYKPVPYHRDPDETVQCPSCGKFNDTDAAWCDQCGVKLTGRNDVEETTGPGTGTTDRLTAEDVLALVRHEIRAASGVPGSHGDHERWDPDGDGDCDACPGGDTDHDYWSEDGTQLQDVPGKPLPSQDKGLTADEIRAIIREEMAVRNADVDNSPWDASKAWHNGAESDDPASFYAGICAGKKDGDKSTQAAWALPYKYHPGDPPNAAGVKNALSRLPQTQGLTNEAEAKATLQAAMKKVNPDYEPDDSTEHDISGIDLEQIRAALKGAKA